VVVGLSDLHLGSLLGTPWLAALVRQMQAERPDMIVFIGDIFEGHSAPDSELLAELRRLSAPLGVWGVLGNHEFHAVSKDNATFFEAAGIHLLRTFGYRATDKQAIAVSGGEHVDGDGGRGHLGSAGIQGVGL